MSVVTHSTVVTCDDGLPMALDVHVPAGVAGPLPVSVVCHGFKGFKDWGLFGPLCDRLAARGRAVARFDLSHSGTAPETPGEFSRLDLFEAQTVTRHVTDLGRILDELDGGEIAERAGLQRNAHFNVVGHSLGGGVALLRAADDGRVTQVATLNGVSHFRRVPEEALAELETAGHVTIPNARTGQDMPLGRAWFEDLAAHDLESSAQMIFVPTLVLQGDADPSVLPSEGTDLADWIPGSRLVMVEGGDHTFGAVHPFAGWTAPLERVAAELDEFLPHTGRLGGI